MSDLLNRLPDASVQPASEMSGITDVAGAGGSAETPDLPGVEPLADLVAGAHDEAPNPDITAPPERGRGQELLQEEAPASEPLAAGAAALGETVELAETGDGTVEEVPGHHAGALAMDAAVEATDGEPVAESAVADAEGEPEPHEAAVDGEPVAADAEEASQDEIAAGGGGKPPIDETPPGGRAEDPGDGDGENDGEPEDGQPAQFPHGGVRRTLHGVSEDLRARGVNVRELLGAEDQELYDALTDPSRTTAQLREDLGVTAGRLYKDGRALVQHVLDATTENLGIGAPERELLGGMSEGLASMGVDLAEVLPDRTLQRVVELLRDGSVTYADVGDQLGVDVDTVRGMVSSVVGLISERVPGIIDRSLDMETEATLAPSRGPAATERWGRGEVPMALDRIKELLANQGHELGDFLPEKAAGLRAAAPLFAEGLSDEVIADRLGVGVPHVSNMRVRLVDTLIDHVPANVVAPQLMPTPRRVLSEAGHVGARVNDMIREAGLTPTQVAREIGISQPRMSRFLSEATRPVAEEVLLPVLRRLNAPPELIEELLEEYGPGVRRGPGWAGRNQ
jgi:hypothetical protein